MEDAAAVSASNQVMMYTLTLDNGASLTIDYSATMAVISSTGYQYVSECSGQ